MDDAPESFLSTEETVPMEPSDSFDDDGARESQVDLLEAWPNFLAKLIEDRPHLGSFLSHGAVVSATPHTVDIRFSPAHSFPFQEVTKQKNRTEIENRLENFAQAPVKVHITVSDSVEQGAVKNYLDDITEAVPSIEDDMKNEPIIKTILDIFDGEVLT